MKLSIRNCYIIILLQTFSWGAFGSSFATSFRLGILGDFYATEAAKGSSNGQIHGRFNFLYEDSNSKTFLELGAGGLAGDETETYVILPQFYYRLDLAEETTFGDVSITTGRVVKEFSKLDDYWRLGDIQPLYRWDALKPETQGLTGVFLDTKAKNIELTLFATSIYLPSQGPSYKLINGKLISGNPWFSAPVSKLRTGTRIYDLQFNVDTPEVSDVIFRPSWGASTKIKTNNEIFWLRASYFKKYRNELATPLLVNANIVTNIASVRVVPKVVKHEVSSVDVGVQGEEVGFVLSGMWEANSEFEIDNLDVFLPVYSDQYKVGANFSWQVNSFHRLEVGGLRTFDNQVRVAGGIAGIDELSAYDYRNQYENTVDVRWSSVYMPRAHGFLFQTTLRTAYDYKADVMLVSANLEYTPLSELTFFIHGDFFGGDEPSSEIKYTDVIAQYLENDRVQGGVKYVF